MLAVTEEESDRRLRAQSQPSCFACGRDNPCGLRIVYQLEGTGEAMAVWTPPDTCEGFRGIVHGGVVTTALDEAMSKAVAATGREALTAELRVRFRRHVVPRHVYTIRGWVISRSRRLIKTEALLTGEDGTENAHAWATFLELPMAGA